MPRRRDSWGSRDVLYPRSPGPRPTHGGVKARTTRGAFTASWHGKRFLDTLEALDPGARLARGRTYARKGQVISIQISEGRVEAQVQGSRPHPYRVEISLPVLSPAVTARAARHVAEDASVAAALLQGTVPPELEEAFQAEDASLFPTRSQDLNTDCSCPDWANPCKHIAAVYYLLAEELDRNPFLLLTLRGVDRSSFLPLAPAAGAATPGTSVTPSGPPSDRDPPSGPPDPDPETFWGRPEGPDHLSVPALAFILPSVTAPLVRRLGPPPFWQGEMSLEEWAGELLSRAAGRWLSWEASDRPGVEDRVLEDLGGETPNDRAPIPWPKVAPDERNDPDLEVPDGHDT